MTCSILGSVWMSTLPDIKWFFDLVLETEFGHALLPCAVEACTGWDTLSFCRKC